MRTPRNPTPFPTPPAMHQTPLNTIHHSPAWRIPRDLVSFGGKCSLLKWVIGYSFFRFSCSHWMVAAFARQRGQGVPREGVGGDLQVTRLIPDAKGTSCNQRLERISGTQHTYILRVPFRNENGILKKWISRFDVWSYLEKFVELLLMKKNLRKVPYDFMDAAGEIAAELQGTPDFIIGNYSDGNLVASLLSYKMGITHCNIAHALEKTKYPDSDIFWNNFDEKYHFSCQFTTDIIVMNNADFIITSTYQEIAGSGHLDDRSKPILFSMARLDRVKDITGLVEAFAKCAKLRELVNLVVIAGYNDVKKSKDREEIAEIEKMHELIKTHKLFRQFCWISAQTNRARNGELYRYIANTHGAFVQPTFYEAFGLTDIAEYLI
ncbi:hypothetical protein Zm00014a_022750 [Zea mays]|uniref:sucrose synthase n=1 Tax=Zea mays TaxID=4577 RepID=A0A3L6ESB4_MAIZE|nr:hypothetical protein Zm00014a_022750 [Zea mays]